MVARHTETEAAEAHAGGLGHIVELSPDHPGFLDRVYRERRDRIAQLALTYKPGTPVPRVEYTRDEHGVWRVVWENLSPLHDKLACTEYMDCYRVLEMDREQIPQLVELNPILERGSGFWMVPVAGLVESRTFHGYLAKDNFLSTQYIRHHSRPLYTPEPDIVHELVGHAATLMHPEFARLNRAFGRAAQRVDDATLTKIERVYWYTMEFGVVQEGGKNKAYGAGLLSSFGELGSFEQNAKLLPLDPEKMAALPYDPTDYQKVLFVAPSFKGMADTVTNWLDALPSAGEKPAEQRK